MKDRRKDKGRQSEKEGVESQEKMDRWMGSGGRGAGGYREETQVAERVRHKEWRARSRQTDRQTERQTDKLR